MEFPIRVDVIENLRIFIAVDGPTLSRAESLGGKALSRARYHLPYTLVLFEGSQSDLAKQGITPTFPTFQDEDGIFMIEPNILQTKIRGDTTPFLTYARSKGIVNTFELGSVGGERVFLLYVDYEKNTLTWWRETILLDLQYTKYDTSPIDYCYMRIIPEDHGNH
jgi:hypothetical protein